MTGRISLFFGNTIYLAAIGYYTVISFLGYNSMLPLRPSHIQKLILLALPFLHHTELLLSPLFVFGILWFASLFGFNIPQHIGPILVIGVGSR